MRKVFVLSLALSSFACGQAIAPASPPPPPPVEKSIATTHDEPKKAGEESSKQDLDRPSAPPAAPQAEAAPSAAASSVLDEARVPRPPPLSRREPADAPAAAVVGNTGLSSEQ